MRLWNAEISHNVFPPVVCSLNMDGSSLLQHFIKLGESLIRMRPRFRKLACCLLSMIGRLQLCCCRQLTCSLRTVPGLLRL